jgi:hypothetical protein
LYDRKHKKDVEKALASLEADREAKGDFVGLFRQGMAGF